MSEVGALIFLETLLKKPNSRLGLATGSTPLGLYKKLTEYYKSGFVSFKNAESINLDEYVGLPEGHSQSYRLFMKENLFSKVDIDLKNTYFPDANANDLDKSSKEYSEFLKKKPQDIQLLGLGNNGHIGFNEPGTPFDSVTHKVALTKSTIMANARFFSSEKEVPSEAVTMGIMDIFRAEKIVLLASGVGKANAVKELVNDEPDTKCPASALKYHRDLTVILDTAAASLL
jgi:glucosamine-6-phosphate deaminase